MPRKGQHWTPEQHAKFSASRRGRPTSPCSEQRREKVRAALKSSKKAKEARKRVAAALTGRRNTPEAIANIRAAHQTPEYRAKMAALSTGRRYGPLSPERKAAISATFKGRPKSAEHRAKISAGRMGCKETVPRSEQWRAKMSAAMRGRKRQPWEIEKIVEGRRKMSPEAKAAIAKASSERLFGKEYSVEARQNMSAAQKRRTDRPSRLSPEAREKMIASRRSPDPGLTHSEYVAKRRLVAEGWTVHRFSKGAPDFLVERDGVFQFVEVKPCAGRLSRDQRETHALLARLGWPVELVYAPSSGVADIPADTPPSKVALNHRARRLATAVAATCCRADVAARPRIDTLFRCFELGLPA